MQKLHNTPLILAGKMYADLVTWSRTYMLRLEFPLVREEDLAIPLYVEDGPAILRIIREHHAEWKHRQGQRAEKV